MASLSEIIVGFLDALGRNPTYMLLFVAFIILLILALLAHHIHSIRAQEVFVHGRQGAPRRRVRGTSRVWLRRPNRWGPRDFGQSASPSAADTPGEGEAEEQLAEGPEDPAGDGSKFS